MDEKEKQNQETAEQTSTQTPPEAQEPSAESENEKKKTAKKSDREAKKEKKLLSEKDEKIAQLEKQLSEEHESHLRMMAEYDNFRKRAAKEKESIYSDALCETAASLLPLLDNLERALCAETDKESGMYKGVEMIMKQCVEIFQKLGISEIEALGKTFDPNLHNAVMHDEDETKGEQEISEVFQKGYARGEKVLRHSVVKVSN